MFLLFVIMFPKVGIAQSKKSKAFALKVKGMNSKGLVSLGPILRVPFVAYICCDVNGAYAYLPWCSFYYIR